MPKRNKVTFRTCSRCKRGFVVAPHRTRSIMCQRCEDEANNAVQFWVNVGKYKNS